VYAFASLQIVAYYGNYTIVTTKLSSLLFNFLGGTGASVGNLIAEGDKTKIMKVYWELMSIRFIFTSVVVFAMYHLLPPFIALWLGDEYIMSHTLLVLVLITFVLSVIRGVTEDFLMGYGLFSDVWAPFVEATIMIAVAIIGGVMWGFEGTLLGSIVSSVIVIYIWKPYFLFRKGLKTSVWEYWKELSKFIIAVCGAFYLTIKLLGVISMNLAVFSSWIDWIIYSMVVTTIFSIIVSISLFITTQGTRDFSYRLIKQ
jgi:O-antigen/teichoic acid export membrane protein